MAKTAKRIAPNPSNLISQDLATKGYRPQVICEGKIIDLIAAKGDHRIRLIPRDDRALVYLTDFRMGQYSYTGWRLVDECRVTNGMDAILKMARAAVK